MNKYLPSKNFLKFFGIVILIIGGIWLISYLFSPKTTYEKKGGEEELTTLTENSVYTLDTDKDGIYDWEEGLWGTSPTQFDTNGDGASDGDEIRLKKEEIKRKNNTSDEEPEEDLNQTEVFARQFFATASLVNQQGGLTPEMLKSFSDSFGQSITSAAIPDPFTLLDIELKSVTASDYKKSLDLAYKNLVKSGLDDLSIVYRFASGEVAASDDLDKLIFFYQELSNNLLQTPAPHNAAGIHLAMANNTAKMSLSLINIRSMNEDPLTALTGLRQYSEYSKALEDTLYSLADYLQSSGIIN